LFKSLIFRLLMSDVRADHPLIATDSRDIIPPRLKMLPNKIALTLTIDSGHVDRAFPLDVPDHLRHCILRWDRNQHMNMVRHQVSFFDPALSLSSQLVENLPSCLVPNSCYTRVPLVGMASRKRQTVAVSPAYLRDFPLLFKELMARKICNDLKITFLTYYSAFSHHFAFVGNSLRPIPLFGTLRRAFPTANSSKIGYYS